MKCQFNCAELQIDITRLTVTIKTVTNDRVAQVGEMPPDLMLAARLDAHIEA